MEMQPKPRERKYGELPIVGEDTSDLLIRFTPKSKLLATITVARESPLSQIATALESLISAGKVKKQETPLKNFAIGYAWPNGSIGMIFDAEQSQKAFANFLAAVVQDDHSDAIWLGLFEY